jgi:hypothetical protein
MRKFFTLLSRLFGAGTFPALPGSPPPPIPQTAWPSDNAQKNMTPTQATAPGSFADGYSEGRKDLLYGLAAGYSWAEELLEEAKRNHAQR